MEAEEKTNVMADINVTPMVDVMLVLLIIFMVVTPLIAAGFQLELPEGVHLKSRPDDPDRLTLGIDRAGNYYLNRQPIAKADAQLILSSEFANRPEDKVLYLRADKELMYSEVMAVMVMARAAGARVVAAVSDTPAPGSSIRSNRIR